MVFLRYILCAFSLLGGCTPANDGTNKDFTPCTLIEYLLSPDAGITTSYIPAFEGGEANEQGYLYFSTEPVAPLDFLPSSINRESFIQSKVKKKVHANTLFAFRSTMSTKYNFSNCTINDNIQVIAGTQGFHENYKRTYKDAVQYSTLYEFSRIGINNAAKEAIVYMQSFCGYLCGEGEYLILTYQDGHWKVRERIHLWVS